MNGVPVESLFRPLVFDSLISKTASIATGKMMRIFCFVVLTTIVGLSTANGAQRRPQNSPLEEKKVSVVIALKVNGAPYNFTGQAVCEHIPRGSIYNIPAERWSARHDDNGRSLNFTLWHPSAGRLSICISLLTCRTSLVSVNCHHAMLGHMQPRVGLC